MLTTGNYWEVVEFLREHELYELVILNNQFIKANDLIALYTDIVKEKS